VPFLVVDAQSPELVGAARTLMIEYRDSIRTPLCFQGFDAEMDALPGRYAPPTGAMLLAVSPVDGPVGCIALREIEAGGLGRTCEMKRMYVRPPFRAKGVGRALCNEIIRRGKAMGYQAMRLDTDSDMLPAQRLYQSLGFKPIPKYNNDPIPDTLFFELDLR
jgi:GNAT superfamily N-acetyltransferase